MAFVFDFEGYLDGKLVKSTHRADNRAEAINQLIQGRGIEVKKCEPRRRSLSLKSLWASLSGNHIEQRIAFFRGFSALERVGEPFDSAMARLESNAQPGAFRDGIGTLRASVRRGDRISEAMAEQPDIFSQFECAMLAAAERGTSRVDILERLSIFIERDSLLRKRLSAALSYPITAGMIALGMSIFILVYLLPTFAHFYTDYERLQCPAQSARATRHSRHACALRVSVQQMDWHSPRGSSI
jgi:type IV pilus assembly protein PilC